jgi:hypothetical protein
MMPARWGIRSYNAFLRAAKARYDLTQAQARVMARAVADRLGRAVIGADVKRHPVIARQEASKAPRREAAQRAAATRRQAAERAAAARREAAIKGWETRRLKALKPPAKPPKPPRKPPKPLKPPAKLPAKPPAVGFEVAPPEEELPVGFEIEPPEEIEDEEEESP